MNFNFEEWADEVDYATYDPDDNKIRIYSGRVERELYDALKGLKFNRAYKQGCFYGTWTPAREDVALALCGEIDDEDTSLQDRAEDRHARFATYSSNAEKRAKAAIKAGDDAVAGIPFGQPILVGHHSERKHRKAVEKAQRAAERTVEEVDRRDYWAWRARGVLRNANRTFDRGVVMRRIKKLESERRKKQRELNGKDYDHALGFFIWDLEHEYPDEFAENNQRLYASAAWRQKRKLESMPKTEARLQKWQAGRDRWCNRWIEHLDGQVGYWKALLEEKHDVDIDEQYPLKKGCWIRCGYGWAQVERVNKGADKRISSVSVDPPTASWYKGPGQWFYPRKVAYEKIKEWSETDPSAEKVLGAQLERIGPPRKAKEPDSLREQAEAKAEKAAQVEVKVNWNADYFPTPLDIVEIMLNEAAPWLGHNKFLLEPSAGDGRIIERALYRWPKSLCSWYEIDYTAQQVLFDKGLSHLRRGFDFLDAKPEPLYDAVVMNPPFSRGKAVKHLFHAWEFVKPGGVLVSVQPGSAQHIGGSFRDWVEDKIVRSIDLGQGAFKDMGTMIGAHILVIEKASGNYEQQKLF